MISVIYAQRRRDIAGSTSGSAAYGTVDELGVGSEGRRRGLVDRDPRLAGIA
jgi:hypothetical protein